MYYKITRHGWITGLTKDGRVLYGPKDKDLGRNTTPCDLDVCNGQFVQDANGDDVYGYFATDFHPYTVGCWGPGNSPDWRLITP